MKIKIDSGSIAVILTIIAMATSSLIYLSDKFNHVSTWQAAQEARAISRHENLKRLEDNQRAAISTITQLGLTSGILIVRVEKLEDGFERIVYKTDKNKEHSIIRKTPIPNDFTVPQQ